MVIVNICDKDTSFHNNYLDTLTSPEPQFPTMIDTCTHSIMRYKMFLHRQQRGINTKRHKKRTLRIGNPEIRIRKQGINTQNNGDQ